jgi:hypothetical protein
MTTRFPTCARAVAGGDLREVLDELRSEVRRLEGGYGDPLARKHIPTGLAALDNVLPGRGLPSGSIIEIEGPAWPPWTLALLLARGVLDADRTGEAVVIDLERDLYPPAMAGLGLDLDRTAIVWPRSRREAAWAFAEALSPRGAERSGCAVALAVRGSEVAVEERRCQLAAEAGGGIGILLAGAEEPRRRRRSPGCAAVRCWVAPCPSTDEVERFQVDVVRCRGGPDGGRALVEVDRAALFVAAAAIH